MMELWQAVVLGVVQGLTEFLPISSTAHLLLVQEWWFGRSREQLVDDPFTVVIQLGTIVAVLVYFRTDISNMTRALLADVRAGWIVRSQTLDSRLAKFILLGTIPGGVAGLLFKSALRENFYNAFAIAIVAIVFALVMFVAEWQAVRRRQRAEAGITVWDALFIGCFQALALMPGGSRSGCTISAGLFAGLTRPAAARFSFLLSVPIMLAAGFKEIYDWLKLLRDRPELRENAAHQGLALALGTAVSAIVGYLAIAWLLNYLRKYSMNVFVIYRIALGAGILAALAAGLGQR